MSVADDAIRSLEVASLMLSRICVGRGSEDHQEPSAPRIDGTGAIPGADRTNGETRRGRTAQDEQTKTHRKDPRTSTSTSQTNGLNDENGTTDNNAERDGTGMLSETKDASASERSSMGVGAAALVHTTGVLGVLR